MSRPSALIAILLIGCSPEVKTVDTSADSASTSETQTDTTTTTTTTTETTTTATGTGLYANCESTFTTSISPNITHYVYNAQSRILQINVDNGGDGSIDDTTDYLWTLDATGTPVQSVTQGTGGASTLVDYDAQGWPIYILIDDGASPPTSIAIINTYDIGLIVRSDHTFNDGTTIVWLYDSCENVTDQTTNLFGDGTLVANQFTQWTYASGCTPSQSVILNDTLVFTTTYDADGRPIAFSATGAVPITGTWTWTCP